jgi:hypothetical protein
MNGLGRLPSPDDPRDWPIRSLLNVGAITPVLPARHVDRVLDRSLTLRFDQGSTSSCVGQSTALVKRVQERRDLFRDLDVDAYSIWRESKLRDGLADPASDRGTFIRTALDALRVGAPVGGRWDARLRLAAYYRITTIEEAKAAIFATGPIVVGSDWYSSWFRPGRDGTLPRPDTNVGGHAFVLYGFDDNRGAFIAANSWGPRWGDEGNFLIQYEHWGGPLDEAWKLVDALDLPKGG